MKKVLLQVPDGLKRKVLEIADEIDEDVLISGESCFGACDLRLCEAEKLGVDKILHYGHTKFLNSKIPVDYKEIREDVNPVMIIEKNIDMFKDFEKIGLVASLQFLDTMEVVKEIIEDNGKKVIIGKGTKTVYPGQILGCDADAGLSNDKKVDCFLSVGCGKFHSLGLVMNTSKPVFAMDVERNEISNMTDIRNKFVKQKYAAVASAKFANRFGILVSTKPGQMNIKLAEELKEKLVNKGKKAWIIVFDEIKPEKLEGIELDAYINTACPRIAIEDRTSFKKPILNPDELDR
jgi:2-(3-amino-3-carboxypropyl)histidine synthase